MKTVTAIHQLRLAREAIQRELDATPPVSEERIRLLDEKETLRRMIERRS